MESIKRYIRKSQRSGETMKEKAVNEGRRNFTKILNENPTSFEIQATIPDEVCITSNSRYIMALITDVTLNDQRTMDEKYIHYDTKSVWWMHLVKLVIGFALVMGVKSGLKPVLALVFGEAVFANGIRYFAVTVFGACVCPLIFKAIQKKK